MPPETVKYAETQPLSIPAAPSRRARNWGGGIPAEGMRRRGSDIPAEQSRRRGRRRGRAIGVLSSIMLGGVVLLILAAIVGMMLGVWRFTVIDTGSMRPTLNPGDVAVLTSEPTADLRKGQIVAFHPPGEPHLTVTHRAVAIRRVKNGVIIRTKGDANNARDPWRAHIIGATVWHEDFRLPKFGYLAVWSQQRLIRFGLLSMIVALIVSMQLGWIWRPTSR